jgi:hypothetical protein
MLRKLVICSTLPFATLCGQITIVSQTGTTTAGILALSSVSWTQSSTYSNIRITASFFNFTPSSPGAAATGTAYLTTQIGSGTTVAQQIASVPVAVTSTAPVTVTLFSGLTLGPGTYYLSVNPNSAVRAPDNLTWAGIFSGGGATVTTAPGVTANENTDVPSTPAAYPPASTFIGGLGRAMLYTVTGVLGLPPSAQGAPALDNRGVLTMALLLGASGTWLARRARITTS